MKVTLLMGITLDGKIAKDSQHLSDWQEKADKVLFVEKTKEAGVIIMGRTTYDTIGRPLPGRKNLIMTRSALKSDHPDLEYTNDSPAILLQKLEEQGYKEVVVAGGTQINTLFAKEGLIDEVLLTISPVLFGSGLTLFDDDIQMDLQLLDVQKIGENTIKAHYTVQK